MERVTEQAPRFYICIPNNIVQTNLYGVAGSLTFGTANMRLFNLLLLLTTSVSGFAQSFMNVKITLSDKVITVPKEDFVSLSFEEAKEQKEEFQDEIYIVGYDDNDPMCGIHSVIWSNKDN